MAMKEIKPQYTVDTYIEKLKRDIDKQEKFAKQQGVLAEVICSEKATALNKIEQARKYRGTERLEMLSRMLDYNTRFCKSEGDIYSTAKRTVLNYCCTDVITAYGFDYLVGKLISAVPKEYWYATDMADSGVKTRETWCTCVFSGSYKRPTDLKSETDSAMIVKILSVCSYNQGVINFGDVAQYVGFCDIFNEDGILLYCNVPIDRNMTCNPAVPLTLRLHNAQNNVVYVMRIWCGDDSSGIKGRKAMYISVFDAQEMVRYRKVITM